MYTKENLCEGAIRRKSIRGWGYSLAAALFLIVMAVVFLAAKRPEEGNSRRAETAKWPEYGSRAGAAEFPGSGKGLEEGLRKLSAETMEAEGQALELIRISEKDRQLWKEKFLPPLIAVDAGHGGVDSGCLGNGKIAMEKDINLEIAFRVREELEEKGFRVMMLRETDEFLEKEERAELANSYQADAYVSIHQNTYEGKDKSIGGIETWYDGGDGTRDSKTLAECVHREALRSAGAVERSLIDSDGLYVLSKTLMPACLIETGFLSNPEECRRLSDPAYQEKLAEGIANGIMEYFRQKSSGVHQAGPDAVKE